MNAEQSARRLLELAGKATSGPWYYGSVTYDNHPPVAMVSTDLGMINPLNHDHHICGMDAKKMDTAEFIAESRTLAPKIAEALLVALEALETIVVDVARLQVENPEAEEFQMVADNAQRTIQKLFAEEK